VTTALPLDGSVDVHTHYIDPAMETIALPACVRLKREGTNGGLYRGETLYRAIDERSWDVARRIADMDAAGVAVQVLSPIPVSYCYEAAAADAEAFARAQNDALAAIARARPDRFAALGTVPLQDVERACAELDRCMTELALSGIEIGTTAGGRELDDAALEPFWERCEAHDAIVFVHPESAPGFDRVRRRMMVISTGYPSETGIAAAMLLTSDLLARRRLRILLAHGAGTLPWILPRLDRLWEMTPELRESAPRPSELARTLYCDTLTFDARNLALVLERFDPARVVVGSDYPFRIREEPPGAVADSQPALRDELRRGNALRLLGRTQAS
jgi:aminocarboxymuconate-semialdehyde decarboxylase